MASARRRLINDLEKLRRARGLTQGELASRLGVTQPHLSRVISGAVQPGNKLEFRISELLGRGKPKSADEWIECVSHAAKRSLAFRALVNAALRLAKNT